MSDLSKKRKQWRQKIEEVGDAAYRVKLNLARNRDPDAVSEISEMLVKLESIRDDIKAATGIQ